MATFVGTALDPAEIVHVEDALADLEKLGFVADGGPTGMFGLRRRIGRALGLAPQPVDPLAARDALDAAAALLRYAILADARNRGEI